MDNQLAQLRNPILSDNIQQLQNAGGAGYLSSLIGVLLTLILIAGSLYFVFMLLSGGLEWMRAGSDKASLEQARSKLVNAIIGIVLLFSAWAVFKLIGDIFGVNLLLIDLPTIGS